MFQITGNSLNSLTSNVCDTILSEGTELDSRNGKCLELLDYDVYLMNPLNRHLYLRGRTNNIYAAFGEIFWVMAGETNISPVLDKLIPRAINYSDDGETWRAGYGDRLYTKDQIEHVVQMFLADGKNTRRAVMSIWQPQKDTLHAVREQGFVDSKDYPCSNFLWFWIRNNKLYCKLGMRSNDVIFGMSAINIPEFTFLQEIILRLLQNADPLTFDEVGLGYYHHSVISLHVYEETSKQAKDIVSDLENDNRMAACDNYKINIGNLNYPLLKNFFECIYHHFKNICNEEPISNINKIFEGFGVTTKENQLFNYAYLTEQYLKHKMKMECDISMLKYISPDLKEAVKYNKFTPPNWIEALQS